MKRIFIAIELERELKEMLSVIQCRIKPLLLRGRMADPRLFHMTLNYLGEIDEAAINRLKETQPLWVNATVPFSMRTGMLREFYRKNGSILWAGVSSDDRLEAMAAEMGESLAVMGYQPPANFTPHITLFRQAVFRNEAARETYLHMQFEESTQWVDSSCIMESIREDGQLNHQTVQSIFLKNSLQVIGIDKSRN